MGAKRGVFLPPFDELADPGLLGELASSAEAHGWDGFFLWDHVNYRPPVSAIADPWIALAAVACATEVLRLGPMVTPVSRRRVQELARETATLDHLSRGRLTLGVGLGSNNNGELEPFGEVVDARERAVLLDEGLETLTAFWGGGFEPRPLQEPRIPVWVAGRWRTRRLPLRRAALWDGFFPIDLPGPAALVTLADEVGALRAGSHGVFDLVVEVSPGANIKAWESAGATWILTSFGVGSLRAEVRRVIEAGPQ